MKANCLGHFLATVEILEPTLVIVQKTKTQVLRPDWLGGVLEDEMVMNDAETVRTGRLADLPVVLCVLNHPSAKGNYGWQWPTAKYWSETARPSIVSATRKALAGWFDPPR